MMSNRILKRFLTLPNKTAIACAYLRCYIGGPFGDCRQSFHHFAINDIYTKFWIIRLLTASLYRKSGIEVRVVAVGTGQALRNAEKCDGDILITHSKVDESQIC